MTGAIELRFSVAGTLYTVEKPKFFGTINPAHPLIRQGERIYGLIATTIASVSQEIGAAVTLSTEEYHDKFESKETTHHCR
jgi:hypothetical protein